MRQVGTGSKEGEREKTCGAEVEEEVIGSSVFKEVSWDSQRPFIKQLLNLNLRLSLWSWRKVHLEQINQWSVHFSKSCLWFFHILQVCSCKTVIPQQEWALKVVNIRKSFNYECKQSEFHIKWAVFKNKALSKSTGCLSSSLHMHVFSFISLKSTNILERLFFSLCLAFFSSICCCEKLHAPATLFPGRRTAFLWNLTLLNTLETAANISQQLVYDQLANVPKLSLIFCECFHVKQTATRVQKHCWCLCRYTLEKLVLPRIRDGPGTNWLVGAGRSGWLKWRADVKLGHMACV